MGIRVRRGRSSSRWVRLSGGDIGRYREVQGGTGRYRQVQAGLGRYREV